MPAKTPFSFLRNTKSLMPYVLLMGLAGMSIAASNPGETASQATVLSQKPAAKAVSKPATPKAAETKPSTLYLTVSSLDLVKEPARYLNKNVQFDGTFASFTGLGLDYKKALRPAKDYVGVLVKRPDVTEHMIPMSELKMFYPRKLSDAVLNLEVGDTVQIKGNVFSTALNDPWLEIAELKILKKAKPTAAGASPTKNKALE